MYPAFPSAPSVSRRPRLLTRTALSGALLAAMPAGAQVMQTPIQQYYTSGGTGAINTGPQPILTVGPGTTTATLSTVTVNDPRTLIEVGNGAGQFTFPSSPTHEIDVKFGTSGNNRDWITIFRSSGAITVDGILKGVQPNGTIGGNIWLLGQGGVNFTGNASVLTGGLLATTSDISSLSNFLNTSTTSFLFNAPVNSTATVSFSNGAQISGNGGTLAFVAPYVSVASGALVSGTGGTQVLYGSANRYTVSFGRDSGNDFDLLSFEVDLNQNDGSYGNGYGTLLDLNGSTTTAGNIYVSAVNKAQLASSVVNLGGTMTATKATSSDGNIVLSAGGALASGPTGVAPKTGIDTAGNPGFVTSVRQMDLNVSSDFNASGNLIAAATGSILTRTATLANFTSGGDMTLRAGRTVEQSSSVVDPGVGYGPVMYIDPQSTARRGGIFLNSVTVGDDLLVQAVNGRAGSLPSIPSIGGGIDIAEVHLAGMSDAKGDPLGFDSANNGVHALITTLASGDLSTLSPTDVRIALGRPTGVGQFTGHSAADDVRVRSASGVHIEVNGNLHLTEVTAAGQSLGVADNSELFLKAAGSIDVGTATATHGNVLVDAGGDATIGSATAAPGASQSNDEDKGSVSIHAAGSASLTSGNAPADIYVVADGGNATGGTLTAGDDIYVVANGGAASLRRASIDNDLYANAPDTDTNTARGTHDQSNNFTPLIPGFSEETTAGRVIEVKAGSGQNAYLGLGTGGASFTGVTLGRTVDVSAGSDAVVDTPLTSLLLSSVQAGNSITVTAPNAAITAGSVRVLDGPLSISGRSVSINQLGVAGDASVTATAGDILLGDGSSISIGGSFDLHASGNLTVGQDNNGYGYSSMSAYGTTSFTAGGSATLGDVSTQSDLSVTATGGITGGTLSAGGNLLVQASAGNVSLGGASTNEGDIAVSGRAIQITDLEPGSNLTLTASAGDIVVNSGRNTYVYGDVVANASGNLTIGGHANGYGYGLYSNYGNASLTAGGAISVDEIQVGGSLDLHAATMNATGSFYTNGAITGVFTGNANFQQVTTNYNREGGVARGLNGGVSADSSGPAISISSSGGNISALGFAADGDLTVSAAAGGVQASSISTAGNLSLAGRTLTLQSIYSPVPGSVNLQATAGAIDLTSSAPTLNAGGDVTIAASGNVTLGTVSTPGLILVSSGAGSAVANSLTTTGPVATSSVSISGANVSVHALQSAGDVTAIASGNLSLGGGGGSFSAGRDAFLTAGSFNLPNLGTVRDLSIHAVNNGLNTTTVFSATRNLTIQADGALSLPGASSGGDLHLIGTSVTSLGSLSASNDIIVQGSGLLRLAAMTAGRDIQLTGGSLIATGNYQAARDFGATIIGAASFNEVRAGDDLAIGANGAVTAAKLTSTGAGPDSEGNGSNISATGTSVSVTTVASANNFIATANSGALSLGGSGGQVTAGRDMRLQGQTVSIPAVSARDLTVIASGGDLSAPAGLTATRDMTLSASGKLTLASLMVGRDLTLSAGPGGIAASQAINPGRDLTVTSVGDVTFTSAQAGDDIRVGSQGKVSASTLTAGGGLDSEGDGFNIYVSGGSTAITSATAPGIVQITPAPPSAPTPTPPVTPPPTPTPPVTPTPTPTPPVTPTPTPPAVPWAQVYYGGANAAAPTSSASTGLLDIYLNAPRTITDWGSTNGVSDFHPSASQAVHFHFGQTDWIAIVRSGGQIQVDGELKTLIGNSSTVGGNLWLMSGAGVLFGANARVDVGGLLATSASFSSMADALDPSKTNFTFDVAGTGGLSIASGAVLNGNGGALAFVAPTVTSAAGSQVTGRNGTSVLYAATGKATVAYSPTSGGTLGFDSANGDFATGSVNLAGTTNVDGSATIGGTSVNVASLAAGGAVTMLATAGDINATAVTTKAGANFDATGKVALGTLTAAGDVSVNAGDVDITTKLAANSLTAQAKGGNMTLGGNGSSGFSVTGAEMSRLSLVRGASFYAGLTGGGSQAAQATGSQRAQAVVRGDMVLADMSYDPSNLPELDLYVGGGHSVSVTGAIRPTVSGGIIQIGDALASTDWRPSAINISGSFGSAIVYNDKCFDQVVPVGDLRLFSSGDIIFGSAAFQTAVASTAAGAIDVARNSPAVASSANDQLFAVTQELTLAAPGKIVQQNNAKSSGSTVGLLLANQDNAAATVLTVSGAPTALELFGSLIDQTGTLRSSINAAAATELQISGTTKANYRFNGCAIATAAMCSILDTSAVSGAQKGSSIRKELDDQDGTGGA